jgi:hypothetical protein
MIRKSPVVMFDDPGSGYEKFRRRKNINMAQVKRLKSGGQ